MVWESVCGCLVARPIVCNSQLKMEFWTLLREKSVFDFRIGNLTISLFCIYMKE